MSASLVTAFRDKFHCGWPKNHLERCRRGVVAPLGDVLFQRHDTDAHFCAYISPNARRLTRGAINELEVVELTVIVLDVDGPGHQASDAWRVEMRGRVGDLFDEHGAGYMYETAGGFRIVYIQKQPTVLKTFADVRAWKHLYLIIVANFARRFGIEADPKCRDWTRHFRLPFVLRDGVRQERPTVGDPFKISPLTIDASHEDIEEAGRLAREHRGAR